MRASFFFLLVVLTIFSLISTGQSQTFCQKYAAALYPPGNPANQTQLLTAIVVRAAVVGGTFGTIVVSPLFAQSGPLYNLFAGVTKYEPNPNNYVSDPVQQGMLAGKLVAYFGALFGCENSGVGGPGAINTPDMYSIHKNMSINSAMETYFNNALANTLQSFGVTNSTDLAQASTALSFFYRCGSPIQNNAYISNSTSIGRTQICGTSDCMLATKQ
jgi:hypothetical protein